MATSSRAVFSDPAAAKGMRLLEVTEDIAARVLAGEKLVIEGASAQEEATLMMVSAGPARFAMKVADTSNSLFVAPPSTSDGKLTAVPFTSAIEATHPVAP
jgi:hypothetical protein